MDVSTFSDGKVVGTCTSVYHSFIVSCNLDSTSTPSVWKHMSDISTLLTTVVDDYLRHTFWISWYVVSVIPCNYQHSYVFKSSCLLWWTHHWHQFPLLFRHFVNTPNNLANQTRLCNALCNKHPSINRRTFNHLYRTHEKWQLWYVILAIQPISLLSFYENKKWKQWKIKYCFKI